MGRATDSKVAANRVNTENPDILLSGGVNFPFKKVRLPKRKENKMDTVKIGKYIASKRKTLGLTQMQLAEKLGMSDKSVSKWERGVSQS